jgi:hypothetical protein
LAKNALDVTGVAFTCYAEDAFSDINIVEAGGLIGARELTHRDIVDTGGVVIECSKPIAVLLAPVVLLTSAL